MTAFFAVAVGLLAIIPLPHAFASMHLKDKNSANRMQQLNRKLQNTGLDVCNEEREIYKDSKVEYNTTCSSCEEYAWGYAFECSDECSGCYVNANVSIDVCFREWFHSRQYDPTGNLTSAVQVFEITRGAGVPSRGDEFRVEYNFSGSDGFPIPCEAFTNGEKCTSCVYQICANTTDEYGLDVYCPNVLNLNSTLDECTSTYTGAFEFRGWEDFLIDCDVNAGLDVCNEARELYEDNKVEYNTTCSSCEENAMGFAFECSDECSGCYVNANASVNVCIREWFHSRQYDPTGNLTSAVQVFEITRGAGVPSRGDEFRVEYNFSGSDGFPIPCEAFTNGEKCTSCVYQICANTTDEYGLDVYCPNVLNLNSTLDECTSTYTGAFEFRGWEDFLIDCDVNAGLDVCNEARELYEDNKVEYNTTCSSCEENAMGFAFECSDECSTCFVNANVSIDVCIREWFHSEQYDPTGNLTIIVSEYEITRGDGVPSRGTELRFEYDYSRNDGLSYPCEAFINGENCTSCVVYPICANGTVEDADVVDCSNVLTNSIYDECTNNYTGAFEFLGLEDADVFVDCYVY